MLGGSDDIDRTVSSAHELAELRAAIRELAAHTSVSVDDAVLAASELITNALVHGRTPCRLRGRNPAPGGPLRIEVADPGTALIPRPTQARPGWIGGRGLLIVARVTSRWGVHAHDGLGKTVWFEMDPPPAP